MTFNHESVKAFKNRVEGFIANKSIHNPTMTTREKNFHDFSFLSKIFHWRQSVAIIFTMFSLLSSSLALFFCGFRSKQTFSSLLPPSHRLWTRSYGERKRNAAAETNSYFFQAPSCSQTFSFHVFFFDLLLSVVREPPKHSVILSFYLRVSFVRQLSSLLFNWWIYE